MGKRKCSYVADNLFGKLGLDMLNVIDSQLGMDAFALRRVSKSLAKMPVPSSLALAHDVLRTEPNAVIPLHTKGRRHPRFLSWAGKRWTPRSYARSNRWRSEWATLAQKLDGAPVDQLMDAHETLWSVREGPLGPTDRKIDALAQVLDYRLWMACCRKDVRKNAAGEIITTTMSDHESTRTVQRMFRDLGMYNGATSFFHTKYGWLEFTPFLLAAERSNLALAKWLYKTFDPKTTILAVSQAGNNAHALCEAALMRTYHTPEQINDSEMLRWLREVGVVPHTPRDENAAYKQKVADRLAESQSSSQSSDGSPSA